MAEEVTIAVNADVAPFQAALENLGKLSDRFGTQLTGALKGAAVSGRELDDVLRRIGLNLAGMAATRIRKRGRPCGFGLANGKGPKRREPLLSFRSPAASHGGRRFQAGACSVSQGGRRP